MTNIARFLFISVAALLISGCTPTSTTLLDQPATGNVLSVSKNLVGSGVVAEVNTDVEGALCDDDYVNIEIVQPRASSAAAFNADATVNVISLLAAMRSDATYEGFGLYYSASADGLIDKYGSPSTDDILWLCYTSQDVSKINLENMDYLVRNVLDMNTFGQDDVRSVYRD